MSKSSPALRMCKRCCISPVVHKNALLDGIPHIHVFCPQCGNGFWTHATSKHDAAKLWNDNNPKRKHVPVTYRFNCPSAGVIAPVGFTADQFTPKGFFSPDDPEFYS